MATTSKAQTKMTECPLPKGWQWDRLGNVCKQDRQVVESQSVLASRLLYLSLEHIESNSGRILREPSEPIQDEGRSLTYRFDNRHVLYGKLRPYLNKVALPDFEGRCTTELIPILPIGIDREFLAWVLRRKETVDAAMQEKTGSRMPRANMDNLFALEIPLPPLEKQRHIAKRLNEQMAAVESARKSAEEQLRAARQLPPAYLREMFESLFTKNTQKRKLGDFVISYRNGFGRRPTGSEDGGVIVLRLADVTGGKINLETPRRGVMTDEELETYSVKNGDLLFVRVNGSKDLVGRCAIVQDLPEVVSYNDHLIRVRLNDEILPEYVKLVTDTHEVRNFIVEKASTSAGQLTINQEMIGSLEIPSFSLSEQRHLIREYKEKITESNSLVKAFESQLAEINHLPASLLREGFAGGI